MTDLFWPGDERAGDLFSPVGFLDAMVRVEAVWLETMVAAGLFPGDAVDDLTDLVSGADVVFVANGAEAGGNPVIPLLAALRERLSTRNPTAGQWLHCGLTSQDVLDSALMLCARDSSTRLERELTTQITALSSLADSHRRSVQTGRTLTQPATPITFGLKAANWLHGILDARDRLLAAGSGLAGQFGGAAGTLGAVTQLAAARGKRQPGEVALAVTADACERLGLAARPAWHTTRGPMTQWADALVACSDAWGHVANDVLLLGRPEIGELAEPVVVGRGGSSAMPHKSNPVLSVLIRRAALAAPGAAAQLHLSAASMLDERPDGGWHLEWATLATLARRTVTAGSQTTELLAGLQVDTTRMATNAQVAAAGLLAESRSVDGWTQATSSDLLADNLGASDLLIDAALARTHRPEQP